MRTRRLYAALDTLDEKRRVTVVLYYFDDRSVREIAQGDRRDRGNGEIPPFSARRHLRQALTEERSRRRLQIMDEIKMEREIKCCISVQMRLHAPDSMQARVKFRTEQCTGTQASSVEQTLCGGGLPLSLRLR